MRFNGKWLECEDGTRRPVIDGGLFGPDGNSLTFPFLVDSGADSTVLSYEAVVFLGAEVESNEGPLLKGIGSPVRSVSLAVRLWLLDSARQMIPFQGRVLGYPYPSGDDMCVLGRDLLGNFAVIVDRPGKVVCLLAGRHRYVIQES